jgi:microcystin-dependent protein
MSTPFLGEIKIISWNFPPKAWAFCNGQLLPINQNQALFSLFGTSYGGDGRVNFALPDFRGRVPIHVGDGHIQGEAGGQEFHTVTMSEMTQHIHFEQGSSAVGNVFVPTGALLAKVSGVDAYNPPSNLGVMSASSISNTGGSQPHENRQPYLALNFIVALQGIFPSRN